MRAFDHFTPQSLPEALELLARVNGQGHPLAGGTDLLLKMKSGELTPRTLVNIKRLPELQGINYDQKTGLKLGALTTLRELTRSPLIREHYPVLAHAANQMASEQIRSFATVGGNLCNAAPSADLAPPLIALGGTVHLTGPSGERLLLLEDFFHGPGSTALQPGELLKEISVQPPEGQTVYLKHSPRVFMDIAVVGAAVRMQLAGSVCREGRIVLGAVAPVPLRARRAEAELIGPLTEKRIARAAKTAADECSPIDDVRGSAWYRRRMVEVLVKRGAVMILARSQNMLGVG